MGQTIAEIVEDAQVLHGFVDKLLGGHCDESQISLVSDDVAEKFASRFCIGLYSAEVGQLALFVFGQLNRLDHPRFKVTDFCAEFVQFIQGSRNLAEKFVRLVGAVVVAFLQLLTFAFECLDFISREEFATLADNLPNLIQTGVDWPGM